MTTTINNEHKKLNVPNLRFPEFSGEWENHNLTDFMSFKNGMNPEAKQFGRGTKFISVMDILNNQYIYYDNIRASVELQDRDIDNYRVDYGDILFQRSSETLEDVGQANVYLDTKPAIFGGFVIRGKSKGNYNPLFFRYLLSSPTARKRITVKGAGAQHFNIGQDGLSKVSLAVPSLQEQETIGKFLQCIDDRIATQNKIIEDLKKLKSAISRICFDATPLQWKILDEYIERGKAGGTPISTNKSYYNGNIPFLSINDMSTQGKWIYTTSSSITENGLNNSSAWLVPPHSLILSMYASVGLTAINKIPLATSQAMFSMILKPNTDIHYLYYYLEYFRHACIYKYLETGTQSNINAEIVRKIRIPTFGAKRNHSISKTLCCIDERIYLETQLLACFNHEKQYLLSQLFI